MGVETGADEIRCKSFGKLESLACLRPTTRLNRFRKLLDNHPRLESMLLTHQQTYDAIIEGWVRALGLRDEETEGHTRRVADLTVRLAQAMNVDEKSIIHYRRGALLHDVGKLGIPDAILHNEGMLTDEEMTTLRKHPQYAYQWLSGIDYLLPALDIPYCHHEKWDGSGYPRGLCEEEIPLAARLFAVVDVWDALLSKRHYKEAWPPEKAADYISSQKNIHFDPNIADIFLENFSCPTDNNMD